MPGSAGIRGPRRRVEEGTATAVARCCASCVTVRGERFPHIVAGHVPCSACRLGSLLDGRRDQADILRQVAKGSDGCHELRSGREAERVWVKEVPDGGTYKDAVSKVDIVGPYVEGRDVATWASTVQCQE